MAQSDLGRGRVTQAWSQGDTAVQSAGSGQEDKVQAGSGPPPPAQTGSVPPLPDQAHWRPSPRQLRLDWTCSLLPPKQLRPDQAHPSQLRLDQHPPPPPDTAGWISPAAHPPAQAGSGPPPAQGGVSPVPSVLEPPFRTRDAGTAAPSAQLPPAPNPHPSVPSPGSRTLPSPQAGPHGPHLVWMWKLLVVPVCS